MKTKHHRPRRTLKQKLNRTIRLLRERNRVLRDELASMTRERDTARRQFAETRQLNHANAAHTRAVEVAALHQNHRLQVAEARIAGRPVNGELAAAAEEFRGSTIPQLQHSNPTTKSP